MDLFHHRSWFADNDDDGDAHVPSGANNLLPVALIDFFDAERERTPARPPSPDLRDAGLDLEMFAVNTAPTSPSAAPAIYDDEEEDKEEMAAVKTELRRVNEENLLLKSMINDTYAMLQQSRCTNSSSSSSSTPTIDAVYGVPRRRPVLHLRRPPGNDDPESSNATAMRGRSEVLPAGGCGLPKRPRKGKEIAADAASDDREEASVDDHDLHPRQNSNKKLKLSPPPPAEKDEKAAAMRTPRVIVRFRTETGDISGAVKIDGCQWRKYGQKIPKASLNIPRCYYKCSMANNCPMRKHLQKCADDETIVNATYQGAHNHQLPQAALPMKWATAAALEMVVSGSMPSGEALMDTRLLAETMAPGARVPRTATVSISSPFPAALLDLSKNPDPALLQGQPAAVQDSSASGRSQPQNVFGQAAAGVPGRAAPGGRSLPQYVFVQAAAAFPGDEAPAGRSQPQQVFVQPALQIQTAAFPGLQISRDAIPAAFAAFYSGGGAATGGKGGSH